jgi:NAD(P)-dependent dehydrogenase (short-subunit alcohol dehydrogenase family)
MNTRAMMAMIMVAMIVGVFTPGTAGSADSGAKSQSTEGATQQAVLVTGASTGIGRKITELLAARGVFVYAGARKEKDLEELDAIENVQSIRLDVTIQEDIDAAVATVTKEGRGLYGLVNNAGVAILAPLVEVEESELDFIFDVNIYGPYRITKAFSPLIIESKGRISTISSISGILSGTLFGPYSMSKHAMEAFADSLAREMQRFDVKVSVVEPGNYNSAIGTTLVKRMKTRGIDLEGSPYEKEIRGIIDSGGKRSQYKEPDDVAEAVFHALFDEKPKMRYMVVPDQTEAEWTIRKAIEELVQLNEGHAYSYDRKALIGMLDEALAAPDTGGDGE